MLNAAIGFRPLCSRLSGRARTLFRMRAPFTPMTVTMQGVFYRIKRLPPYVIRRGVKTPLKRRAPAAAGAGDVKRSSAWQPGMGRDARAPRQGARSRRCRNPAQARLSCLSRGIGPGMRAAPRATYYARRFGVELRSREPRDQLPTLGPREGYAKSGRSGDHSARLTPCWCRNRAIPSTPSASCMGRGRRVRTCRIQSGVDFTAGAQEGGDRTQGRGDDAGSPRA